MKYLWLLLLMLIPPALPAQAPIPPGTVLPLRLDIGLNAARIKPGKGLRATVMQNIPGTTIHKGDHVLCHVGSVSPKHLELRFDTLATRQKRIPITTNLRALASALEVDQAQIPENGGDRGLPSILDQTTRQIGGEQVYRGGGPVARGITPVGEPTPDGVLGKLNSNPPCRGAVAGNDRPQALWLFSTDACGLYGFDDLTIEHFGRTVPVGTIVLTSKTGKINIRTGSGFLLRVQGS
jgi:hypothetical protein